MLRELLASVCAVHDVSKSNSYDNEVCSFHFNGCVFYEVLKKQVTSYCDAISVI
jgi:hypothetical protein